MSQAFDPYHQWLGISKNEPRPINYYRLLGVEKFEADPEIISLQANRHIQQLRQYSGGPQGDLAEQLINELTKAKLVLLKTDRREAYNRTLLVAQQALASPSQAAPREAQARPATPAATPARVELSSDPAQWDLEGLPPLEPEPLPVVQALPVPTAPLPPAYAQNPAAYSAPYQPYPPAANPYAQAPVPYAPAPVAYSPAPGTHPPVAYQPPLVPGPAVPYPPQYYQPAPSPTTLPAAYPPAQQGPGSPPPQLLPQQLRPQAAAPAGNQTTQYAEESSSTAHDELTVEARQIRDQHRNARLRGYYISVALCCALALVILGTVVGIVVSKFGLNSGPAEPIAANTNVPETKPQPATIPKPADPEKLPEKLKTRPVKTVAVALPAEELFNHFELAAGKRFEWPPIKNPRVPQIVDFADVNENPRLVYRYPGSNPRMATVISQGYSSNRWLVEKDQLLFRGRGSQYEYLLFGDPNWTDYTVEFETYVDEPGGMIPLGLLFRCAEHHHLPMFLYSAGIERKTRLQYWEPDLPNLGLLQNSVGQVSEAVPEPPSSPQSWKKTTVSVSGEKIVAQCDGKTLFDRFAVLPERGQVGIVMKPSLVGNVRVRNIRVTAPDGNVLWEGVPELPPTLDKAVTRLWPQPDFSSWSSAPKQLNDGGGWEVQDGEQGKSLHAKCKGDAAVLATLPFESRNYILELKIRKLRGVLGLYAPAPSSNLPTRTPGPRLQISPASSPLDTAAARPLTLHMVKADDGYALCQNGETVYTQVGVRSEFPEQGVISLLLTKFDSEVVIDEIIVRRMPDSFRLEELQHKVPAGQTPQLAVHALPATKTPQLPVKKVEPAAPPAAAVVLPYKLRTPGASTKAKGLVLKQDEQFEWAPLDPALPEQQSAVHYADFQGRRLVMYRYQGSNPRLATILSRAHMPGRWAIENNELTFENSVSDSEFLLFGDPTWTDYTVEFESYVERTNAICPVGVVFRSAEDQKLHVFEHSREREKANLWMWRPEVPKLSPLTNLKGQPIAPGTFVVQNPGAWKKSSVTVTGDKVIAKRDNLLMFENQALIPANGRVGMKFELVEDGKVHVRNIRVTAPDGKVLWEGLPELPTLLENNSYLVWPEHLTQHWTKVPKVVEKPGEWQTSINGSQRTLRGAANQHPPLFFDNSDHVNYVLEVKLRKVRGEFDLILNIPKQTKEPATSGTRLHLSYANQQAGGAGLPMFLQLTRAPDGFQLRVNDETVIQQRRPSRGFELTCYGFDLLKPDSEIEIEEIAVRRIPHEFRLYDEQFRPRANPPPQRGENGWEIVVAPPGAPKPPVAAANPAPVNPAPVKPVAANEPPRNPLAELVAKNNLDPDLAKQMPAENMPGAELPAVPLAELARGDEDLQKVVAELEKARETYKTKVKKLEEDYLKAFDTEITRLRANAKLGADERAELLEPLLQDKKFFEERKRYSLAHCMLPHNRAIGLILAERQKLDRVYESSIERLIKEKKDQAAFALNTAKRADADLGPFNVCSYLFLSTANATPIRFDFMADKTVNNNPKLTWTIDNEMRLILNGQLQNAGFFSSDMFVVSPDGRKLTEVRSNGVLTGRTAIFARE